MITRFFQCSSSSATGIVAMSVVVADVSSVGAGDEHATLCLQVMLKPVIAVLLTSGMSSTGMSQ